MQYWENYLYNIDHNSLMNPVAGVPIPEFSSVVILALSTLCLSLIAASTSKKLRPRKRGINQPNVSG